MVETGKGNPPGPKEFALATYRHYYLAGTYDADRFAWTIDTFLPVDRQATVLEVGCGDGAMLRLLAGRYTEVQGVDASRSGVERCLMAGLRAQCLDVSTDALPFADDSFDVVLSLETFEHLMNPHFALQEVRRVLRPGGQFLCSVPNPRSGHLYLYPGLFEFKNFKRFLEQSDFEIRRVDHWQWAPRQSILPSGLRGIGFLRSRYFAGALRKLIEKSYLLAGAFPSFCYWLWAFDCTNRKTQTSGIYERVSQQTQPGTSSQFWTTK